MKRFVFILFFLLWSVPGHAADITLRLTELRSGNHRYYHELLTRSLKATGHTVTIVNLGVVPFKRALQMVESGEATLRWYHRAKAGELPLVPVQIGITNNLIGKRVLVIPDGRESSGDGMVTGKSFEGITSLYEFRNRGLIGGFGKGWFDVSVWRVNQLAFVEQDGDWRQLFPMVASRHRGVDYLSRGVGEVLNDVRDHPGLAIEPNLLFTYESDFWFFLTPSEDHLRPLIYDAILEAKRSGLMDELILKYWGADFKKLNLDSRLEIKLQNP